MANCGTGAPQRMNTKRYSPFRKQCTRKESSKLEWCRSDCFINMFLIHLNAIQITKCLRFAFVVRDPRRWLWECLYVCVCPNSHTRRNGQIDCRMGSFAPFQLELWPIIYCTNPLPVLTHHKPVAIWCEMSNAQLGSSSRIRSSRASCNSGKEFSCNTFTS